MKKCVLEISQNSQENTFGLWQSGISIINFEHILHFTINIAASKQMLVGPEKLVSENKCFQ